MEKGESNLYKLLINDDYFKNPREIATSYVETLNLKNEAIIKSKVRNFESYLSRIFRTNSISENEIEYIAAAMHHKVKAKTEEEYQQIIKSAKNADGRELFNRDRFYEHQEFIGNLTERFQNLSTAFICTAKPLECWNNSDGYKFVTATIEAISTDEKKEFTYCLNRISVIKQFYAKLIENGFQEIQKKSSEIGFENFIKNLNIKIKVFLVHPIFTTFPSCIIDHRKGNTLGFHMYFNSDKSNIKDESSPDYTLKDSLDFMKISTAGVLRWETNIYDTILNAKKIQYDRDTQTITEINKRMSVTIYDIYEELEDLLSFERYDILKKVILNEQNT